MIFAFYGTLRKDQPNYQRFGLNKYGNYIGTGIVPGFKMVDVNGWYPKVYPSNSDQDTITVDLIEIEDKNICDHIEMMEVGAGYKSVTVDVNNVQCSIYVGSSKMPAAVKVIPSGDWVKYDTEKHNEFRSRKV